MSRLHKGGPTIAPVPAVPHKSCSHYTMQRCSSGDIRLVPALLSHGSRLTYDPQPRKSIQEFVNDTYLRPALGEPFAQDEQADRIIAAGLVVFAERGYADTRL